MENDSLAPCGVICELCLGYQHRKNKCVGCKNPGNKPNHCTACSIKTCPEKNGNSMELCSACRKFPCRRIRDLDKRYKVKYAESPIENLRAVSAMGISDFIRTEEIHWKCPNCGNLLCVHKGRCLSCGAPNRFFPALNDADQKLGFA